MEQSVFTCRRCGFSTEYKHVLLRHLERKKTCIPKPNCDVSVDVLLQEVRKKESSKSFACAHCDKQFSCVSNKYRHQKTCNKEMALAKEVIELRENMLCLEKELCELKSKPNTVINNISNIQNNIQNNTIVLNSFGNESYDHISDDFLRKCVQGDVCGVKALIERIHFSEEAPENKNIRLKSLKNKLVEVSDKQRWVVKDVDEAMDTMIQKGGNLLNKFFFTSDLFTKELDDLDHKIHAFLVDVFGKNNQNYYAIKRRILALIIENSDQVV